MTDLERLKLLTEELDAPGGNTETGCGCMSPPASARMYTDAQLAMLLELHEGDVRRAAYDVLIRKDGLFVLDELKCLNPENLLSKEE